MDLILRVALPFGSPLLLSENNRFVVRFKPSLALTLLGARKIVVFVWNQFLKLIYFKSYGYFVVIVDDSSL